MRSIMSILVASSLANLHKTATIAAIHAKIYQFATYRGAHPAAALWHAVRQALLRDAEAALPPE
jgi:hypothetical protein